MSRHANMASFELLRCRVRPVERSWRHRRGLASPKFLALKLEWSLPVRVLWQCRLDLIGARATAGAGQPGEEPGEEDPLAVIREMLQTVSAPPPFRPGCPRCCSVAPGACSPSADAALTGFRPQADGLERVRVLDDVNLSFLYDEDDVDEDEEIIKSHLSQDPEASGQPVASGAAGGEDRSRTPAVWHTLLCALPLAPCPGLAAQGAPSGGKQPLLRPAAPAQRRQARPISVPRCCSAGAAGRNL